MGAERPPFLPSMPSDVERSSSPASITLWHELHETVPERESRGSKKSFFPSSTFAADIGLSAGIGGLLGSASMAEATAAADRTRPRAASAMRAGFMLDLL